MKQTTLFKQFFLLVLLLVGSATGAWADETQVTINFGSTEGYWAAHNDASYTDSDSRTWTRTFSAGGKSSYTTNYSQFGNASNTCTDLEFIATAGKDMTLTAFSVTMSGASGGSSPTVGIIYLYKKSGDTETQLATASVNGTNNVTCSITSNQAFSSTDKLEVKYDGTNKAIRVSTLTYSYTTGGGTPTVVTPTFLPAAGTYNKAQSVSISCATDGATIRYTTDGNDPTESSDIYSSPISVTTTGTTIKAKAFKAEMDASSVATATYTIKPTTPTITGGANVTITGDEGCTFYYTTATGSDTHTDPSNESTEYTAPFTPADGTKIKAIAYDAYGNKSDVTSVFTFKYMPLNPKNINSNYYVKVTDASTLENGDAILIVNETAGQALGAQNGNNCPDETVDISDGVISDKGEALKLILVKKTEKVDDVDTEVFYFYTGAGYLYAASSSKNYLKEQNPATTNARATISISSGDAAITFKGSNTHNIVRYNSGDGLFSCYASGQSPVQIYKEVASVDVTDAKYATYVTACDVDFAASTGVTAYKVTGANGKIELEEVDAAPKGTPLVIAAEENTYVLNVAASTPAAVTGNILKASDGNITGDYNSDTKESTYYVLGKNLSEVGFGPLANGVTLAKGKAYIHKNDWDTANAVEFLPFVIGDEESETTSISEELRVKSEESSAYNLAGQKVSKDYKGIVVVNGKKFVRK